MPGPHGFAVRSTPAPKASTGLVPVHRSFGEGGFSAARPARCCSLTENRPANTPHARRCCVHRIPSRVRDDRDPPLVRDETAGVLVLIWGDRERNCFCGRDWTAFADLPVGSICHTKT